MPRGAGVAEGVFWTAFASIVGFVASLLGLADYLRGGRYCYIPAAEGIIDCGAVYSLEQAYILGVHLSVIAPAYFSAMSLLPLLYMARPERGLLSLHYILTLAGIAALPYLLYLELVVASRLCIYCTIMHASIAMSLIAHKAPGLLPGWPPGAPRGRAGRPVRRSGLRAPGRGRLVWLLIALIPATTMGAYASAYLSGQLGGEPHGSHGIIPPDLRELGPGIIIVANGSPSWASVDRARDALSGDAVLIIVSTTCPYCIASWGEIADFASRIRDRSVVIIVLGPGAGQELKDLAFSEASKAGILGTPGFSIYEDGRPVSTVVGMKTSGELLAWYNGVIGGDQAP